MKNRIFFLFVLLLLLISTTFLNLSPVKSSGEIFSVWQTTINLPYPLANYPSFTYLDHIYAINGSAKTGASKTSVISSLINQDGSLVSWNDIKSNTPDALIFHTSTIKENKIYVLGGKIEPSGTGNSVNYVWVGNLDNDGSVINWTVLNPLPKKLSKGKAVIVNNRIYFVGGATWTNSTGPVISDSVYYSDINADGTIGDWTTTTSLPTPLSGHGLIEANGRIITLGGSTGPGETPINNTYSATVFADGTLSSWTDGTNLPVPLRDGGAIKIGSYAVYVGGYSGQFSNKVYYSAIDGNGNLGDWTQSANDLPIAHCCGSLAVWYNQLYLSGGWNGSNYLNTVYTASTTATAAPSSSTPTPTPSPSPTPTPTPPSLIVEDIKQYDPLWKDETYDNTSGTIGQYGCALTSASMVLKYHGFSGADPKILNNWLKGEPDGYLGNGLINWLAVSRYSYLYKTNSSTALEYRRLSPTSENLISELSAGRPAILKEPGHFIVAKSQTATSFGINDPAYTSKTTLASYGDTFSAINSYRPTSTNLSYLLFTINAGYTFKVYRPDGTEITGYTFIEEPLIDDVDGLENSGETLTIFQYPTPSQGEYKVEVSGSDGSFKLDVYSYDNDGNLDKDQITGTTAVILKLNYDDDVNTPLVQAAVISAQSSTTPTSSIAIISWSTDRQTSSRVVYDTLSHPISMSSTNYGYLYSSSTLNVNPKVLSHSVTLLGLSAGQIYYYRTISEGSPVAISEERTFRTLSIAGPPEVTGTNPVTAVRGLQNVPGKFTFMPDITEETNQDKPEATEKEVLGKETQINLPVVQKSFFEKNLKLFIVLFSALAGIAYLQIARPITGKPNKNRKKV